ncbi:MAG: peptidoglycan DD-metalloendopeptidase family protein [Clostridia bacterium]|nr:peptidoglycan DD-metalloendopeptidase family protein [Clostridia bacterium]
MALTNKTKRKINSGGLYIALAVCILSVICVGVYGAVLGLVKPETAAEKGGASLPRVTVEEPADKSPSSSRKTETPKATVPVKETPETPPAEKPEQDVSATPVEPTYLMPLVGTVIKEFSDELLVYSETMNDYRVHNGMDLAAVIGERVKAMSDGVVEKVYDDPLMGQTVILDHGNGLKSVYQSLMPSVPDGVEEGAVVQAGDVIGGVGDTALIECAEEPHLHFEVWRGDTPINPRDLIS